MTTDILTTIHQVIEWFALGIELLAVAVIVAGVVMVAISRGTVRYLFHSCDTRTILLRRTTRSDIVISY